MPFKVYLAGPVTGLRSPDFSAWRSDLASMLEPEIACYSPMRRLKATFADVAVSAKPYLNAFTSDRGIFTQDHYDCRTADLVVAHLDGAAQVSIGTCFELAWAYAYGKPVVATMDHAFHDHPMVRQAITHRARSIEEVAELVRHILLP